MNRLKETREKHSLTIYDVADRTGLNPSYISHLETGRKSNPTKDTMDKLAKALGQTVTNLFYKEE